MKNKKAGYITLLALIGVSIAQFTDPVLLGICPTNASTCIFEFTETYTQPLGLISLSLIFISIVLLFLWPEVFKTWSRFAMVAIPLAVIWIALTPVQSSSGSIAGLGIGDDRESVTWFVSIFFLAVSFIIIAVKSYKLRKT